MARPARRWAPREPVLSVGLWVAGALLSAATVWWGLGPHDEGLMLQAASRIADGQWPYRDFWWNYGPGQPVLLAPFEGSLIAWRVIRIALNATIALLAFHLARRAADSEWGETAVYQRFLPTRESRGDWAPLLAWLAVAAAMAWPSGPGPNPTALGLSLAALLFAPKRPTTAGILAGVATVFRPEIGVAAALGTGRRGMVVAAGVGAVLWLPFLLVAPGDLLDQTIGFLGIQDLQRLPFPLDPDTADPNKLLELYAPLILVAGAALALATRPPLALIPITIVGVAYLLGRTDEFHLIPLAAVLPIVLVGTQRFRPAALALVALIALHGLDRIATMDRSDPAWNAHDAPILDAIGDRSIFVAPPRFDQVTVGDPLLYVLADKPNPTRYDVMQPGVVTTEEVQEEIRADLQRAEPELLIRWLDPRTAPENNGSGESSGVTLLDDYLRATYTRVGRFGAFEVHERRGG